jgi:methyl-accepting chemotaxis protein
MALTIGTAVLLVQAVLVYFVASSIYRSSIESKQHEMELMATTLSKAAADFGALQMERVRSVSKIPALRDFLTSGGSQETAGEVCKAMSLASPDVNSFYLFDAKGKQALLMIQGKTGKLSELADREYVQAALAGKEGFSTAPTKSIATGKLIVSVTAPILDESGKAVGGVGMSYSLGKLIADYIEATRIGATGHPFILSPKGVVVGHPDKEMLLKDLSGEPGVGAMLSTPTGIGALPSGGKEKKVNWTRVPGWEWVMAFSMDKAEIESAAVSERNFMILLGGAAMLLLIGVCLLALEKIAVRPLKQLEAFARRVAGGELDTPLGLRLSNEIGVLADSLRSMVASLKGKIMEADEKTRLAAEESAHALKATREAEEARQAAERARAEGMLQAAQKLDAVVEVISSASEELSAQIEQSSRGAEEQSKRMAETATAMEEMNATVLEVAKNASQAAGTSDGARTQAQEGSGIVGRVVTDIVEVQKQSQALKQDMEGLGKQAEGIGHIMNVISDIADQTNLLALNAAIEAARAGDAGRGFAVVADEVRKLAEKTMTATKEVGEAIRGIQDGTRKNISNVDHSAKTIEDATTLANQSWDALKGIVSLVDQASDQVRSIATASEQQSSASEEINRSIEQVTGISNETAQAMGQASHAVNELARQTQVLQNLIEELKAEGGQASR